MRSENNSKKTIAIKKKTRKNGDYFGCVRLWLFYASPSGFIFAFRGAAKFKVVTLTGQILTGSNGMEVSERATPTRTFVQKSFFYLLQKKKVINQINYLR